VQSIAAITPALIASDQWTNLHKKALAKGSRFWAFRGRGIIDVWPGASVTAFKKDTTVFVFRDWLHFRPSRKTHLPWTEIILFGHCNHDPKPGQTIETAH
jgi:hypothetical protein